MTTTTVYPTGQPGTLVPYGLNEAYAYDSFGNILQNGPSNAFYTANNQMFGYAYDAAGNLLSNGVTPLTWDAESRLTSAAGATYIYDADGNRVEKQGVGGTDTVYFGGKPIARLAAGQWTDLIYGPNGMLAEVAGTQTAQPTYRLLDHLGTEIGQTDASAQLINPLDYRPFGGVFSGNTNDPYLFTGKERDTESGLDYFGARYYASNMGRFMSPDDGTDQHPDNPQSWNLYTYGRNNPLVFTDPTGHSTQTAANGDVLAVYDDKDLGVYRHGDIDNRKDWDGSKLDDTDPQTSKMGQTERWGEFANWNSKNPDGISGSAAPGAFIHFGQSIDGTISSLNAQSNKQGLSSTAIDSTHGGPLDIKTGSLADHGVYTGYLLNGNYASIRSAGNFLAGLNAMTGTFAGSHISPQFAQKLFGAYQAGGKSGLVYTLTTGKAYPGTSAPYWGEENYSGYMQQKGINAGSQK